MRPVTLYAAAATRALDRVAIDLCGISGVELMQRAGRAAFDELRRRWPQARHLAIVCGTGNNGGDGFVIATLACAAGMQVDLYLVGDAARIGGDARACFERARESGVEITPFAAGGPLRGDVVVDALLGTGLDREVATTHASAIAAMNASARPCFAIDVPSGLDASSGRIMGVAVRAHATITFIARKIGLFTGAGPAQVGALIFDDLDIPSQCYAAVAADAELLAYAGAIEDFQPRRRDAHKGDFGHVLIVGGAPGFGGAARMAAEAAGRCGAGLVSIATAPAHAASLTLARPEIMCHACADARMLRTLAARASVVAIGPGLGQDAWARQLFAAARALECPQVVDADALNLLAADPDYNERRILTPHPGEAARLLGVTTGEINGDRVAAAAAIVARYGGVVVLKGAGSVIHAADAPPIIIDGGNPGMASGGMGDVLTGVIAALLAQHFPLRTAAAIGASVHAHAADMAAAGGERGLLAGDLMAALRAAVNPAP